MSNQVNILSKADTLKKISSIKGRSATLREDIQSAVIGALSHAAEYGDYTLLTKLVKATSPQNGAHLKRYIARHSPARWNAKEGQFRKHKKGGVFRVADAIDVYWDAELAAQRAESAKYDGVKVRKSLAKRLADLESAALEAGDFSLLEIVQQAAGALKDEKANVEQAA